MKISNFYNIYASEEWFTKRYGKRPCAHETLIGRGFKVVGREALHENCAEQELPFSMMSLSWGGVAPSPLMGFKNTYLAKEASELSGVIYNSMSLYGLISKWMGLLPGTNKYLISLNPEDYLVTTSDAIEFEDVLTVSRAWKIDCLIGVFDESCIMSFIFDCEFGLVVTSFDPSCTPDGYAEFSRQFNAEFNEVFVRDAKMRTGADPLRAAEYKDKSKHLIG